jgi:hypothetical protein
MERIEDYHEGQTMNEIGLSYAGIKPDIFNETPQDAQHCVYSG